VRIGVDLGGTKIEAIALQGDGTALVTRRVATPAGDYAATLEPMLQDRAALVDSDGAPGKLMDDAALGKNRWGADGSAHRGSRECSGFGGVAAGAEFLGAAYRNAAEQQDRGEQPVH